MFFNIKAVISKPNLMPIYSARQNVHARGSNKVAHKCMSRLIKQFLWRAYLHNLTFVHDHNLIGKCQCLGLIVRDVNHGVPELLVQLF